MKPLTPPAFFVVMLTEVAGGEIYIKHVKAPSAEDIRKYLQANAYDESTFTILTLSEFNERIKDSINTPLTLDPVTLSNIEETVEMMFNDSVYTFSELSEENPAIVTTGNAANPVGSIDGVLFFRRNFAGPKGFKEAMHQIRDDFILERAKITQKIRIFFAVGKQPGSYMLMIDDDKHETPITIDDITTARLFPSYRSAIAQYLPALPVT